MGRTTIAGWAAIGCAMAAGAWAGTAVDAPHLRKQGTATQLIVDGKPFLALAGELGNNTATSLENMQAIWPRLAAGNLNCVLAAVSWAQVEPEEGRFEFALVDGLIEQARTNHLKLVFLWFGSWKNGLSSYAPYWVKADYQRFPRIRLQNGKSMELLSTFGEATRDADARAYRALMRHIKETDGKEHTVLMMQVENEVGVLRDSRDRSAAANRAFAGPVPKALMDYLQQHRETLAPELREVWAANGFKATGTWEEVFGPGKPGSVEIPIQTSSPPLSKQEYETGWRKLDLPHDFSIEGPPGTDPATIEGPRGHRGQGGVRYSDVRERVVAAAQYGLAGDVSQRRPAAADARRVARRGAGHRHSGAGSLPRVFRPGVRAIRAQREPAVHS